MSLRPTDWDDDEREALDASGEELEAIRARYRDAPSLELLRAQRADVLPDPLGQAVAAHLERSPWSRALVEGADAAEPMLDPSAVNRVLDVVTNRAAVRSTPSAGVRRWWRPVLVGAAAAAVAYIVAWRLPHEPRPEKPQTNPVVTLPSAPVFHLALDKPDVKLTARALVLRGDRTPARFIDEIAPALDAYRANDYATAARAFAALHDRYADAVEVSFYLGISRVFLGDVHGAVSALESARTLSDDTFTDDIRWYLAVAYDRAGQRERARIEVEALCRERSVYSARACEAAPQLRGPRGSGGRN